MVRISWITVIIVLCINPYNIYSQDFLNLKINNPQPRVDQEVKLSLNIEFFIENFKTQLGEKIELSNSGSVHELSNNDFNRMIKFNQIGLHKIGPIKFEFNGKKYISDSIFVTVVEKLQIKEGIHLRYVKFDNKHHLILEQMINNQSDYTTTEDGYKYTVGGVKPEGKKFAELIETPVPGVKINFTNSYSSSVKPEDANIFDAGLSYSIKFYEIEFSDDFKGIFILNKSHIINLPVDEKIEEIQIDSSIY